MPAFGRFELQPEQRRLLRDGVPLPIGARAFDVLLALAERRDRLVTKSELLELVWPDVVVEENNLQVQISSLRKLLGPEAIATVPGRGYRFVARLRDLPAVPPHPAEPSGVRGSEPSPSMPVPAATTNLPATIPALLGRDDGLHLLGALVESHRLVTVVGAGGIGKSRLAQAVAHARIGCWPDGVWIVELSGLADSELLPHAVAQPLGLNVPEGDAFHALADALAQREMLLVLDNCEHLVDPVATLVDCMLKAAPELRVLITSQEPLRLGIEQQYRVDPLAVPRDATEPGARGFGSLALFESRVRSAAPRYMLAEEDLPIAIDLCRQLDGLPLAIELAAARVPMMGLRAVHERVRERFRLLTAGARTGLRRHQTLRATMDWSHGLLSDAQRVLFRRLGVFSGGFTIELAHALCADDEQDEWVVLEQLATLVERSLVMADAGAPVRYRLLESARAFALEQLAAAGETAALMQRHAVTMLKFLQRADDGNMDSTLRTDAYAALVLPELDNLRAAYAWAAGDGSAPALAIGLAAHAGPLIDYSTEISEWLLRQRAHLLPGVVDDATIARFWRAMAAINMLGTLTIPEVLDAAQRATACYRALGRPKRLFSALRLLAIWRRSQGDLEGALAALDEAAALIEPDWSAEFRIVVLRFRAWTSRRLGNHDVAEGLYREAIRLAREAGDWRLEVIERTNACDLCWERGEHGEAQQELLELITALRRRAVSDYELVEAMSMRAWVLAESGRLDEAVEAAREALPIMRRMPKFRLEGWAYLLWKLDQPEAAARVLGAQVARQRSGRELYQINEDRILRATSVALETTLPAAVLSSEMSTGESLTFSDACALLGDALSGSPASPPRSG
ncbi:MAG TPA: winged helix-turn-helix domain-containing protein [Burkholderiaceae bacterium]|nr:winged helix-turn-helix domain-containing protein [Burkholderiaceae bacterium]